MICAICKICGQKNQESEFPTGFFQKYRRKPGCQKARSGRNLTAQGNALGHVLQQFRQALKGRNIFVPPLQGFRKKRCLPYPGLRPGLSNVGLSGRKAHWQAVLNEFPIPGNLRAAFFQSLENSQRLCPLPSFRSLPSRNIRRSAGRTKCSTSAARSRR